MNVFPNNGETQNQLITQFTHRGTLKLQMEMLSNVVLLLLLEREFVSKNSVDVAYEIHLLLATCPASKYSRCTQKTVTSHHLDTFSCLHKPHYSLWRLQEKKWNVCISPPNSLKGGNMTAVIN